MADPIQISYDSAGIQAKLDAAGTAVQSSALPGLATTIMAESATAITATSTSQVDLDSITTPGTYKATQSSAQNMTHCPTRTAFRLEVVETSQHSPTPRLRETLWANTNSTTGVYLRYHDGTSWGDWVSLVSSLDIWRAVGPEMVMHSEFEWIQSGWWNSTGGLSNTSLYHSGLVPIIPGGRHYMGYLYSANATIGAFFDATGNWISSLSGSSVTEFPVAASGSSSAYKTPNGNGGTDNYVSLYYFDAPANACYFSYNLATSDDRKYRQYVSSKPVFMLSDSGNYVARPGDPVYQAKKDKKLCIIGPSAVMIDRYDRSAQGNDTPYVVGFQEYLMPWYQTVDSYGFSGGAWPPATGETYTSIYNGIMTAPVDLSGYDEFLLLPSYNSFGPSQVTIGDWDSTNTAEYFGAVNAVIDYIYDQVPTATIWLADFSYRGSYYDPSRTGVKAKMIDVNEKLVTLTGERSYKLIQASRLSGFNEQTYEALTYDGTHNNSEGNRVFGLCFRKAMLGF